MNCPAAMERIREDKPITIRDDKGNTSRCIAEIVSVSQSLLSATLLAVISKLLLL